MWSHCGERLVDYHLLTVMTYFFQEKVAPSLNIDMQKFCSVCALLQIDSVRESA